MLKPNDMNEVCKAYAVLENPGFRIKAINLIGKPIEKGIALLPDSLEHKISQACNLALDKAASIALFTLPEESREPSNLFHRAATWATGALGGFGGLPGTLLELPVSTTIMLRSIFEIAQNEGEDLNDINTKIAALQVFALGGESKNDDVADTAYYSVRVGMASEVQAAYRFLTKGAGKLTDKNAPAIIQLVQKIAARFSIPVTEKAIAQAMPFISAGIGVLLNDTFIAHFQEMAKAHFTLRRLERTYGQDAVRQAYELIKKEQETHE